MENVFGVYGLRTSESPFDVWDVDGVVVVDYRIKDVDIRRIAECGVGIFSRA